MNDNKNWLDNNYQYILGGGVGTLALIGLGVFVYCYLKASRHLGHDYQELNISFRNDHQHWTEQTLIEAFEDKDEHIIFEQKANDIVVHFEHTHNNNYVNSAYSEDYRVV